MASKRKSHAPKVRVRGEVQLTLTLDKTFTLDKTWSDDPKADLEDLMADPEKFARMVIESFIWDEGDCDECDIGGAAECVRVSVDGKEVFDGE